VVGQQVVDLCGLNNAYSSPKFKEIYMSLDSPIRTEVTVTGMTCEHCVMSVMEEISGIDGVDAVDVTWTAGP
jgi:copper chaperone